MISNFQILKLLIIMYNKMVEVYIYKSAAILLWKTLK